MIAKIKNDVILKNALIIIGFHVLMIGTAVISTILIKLPSDASAFTTGDYVKLIVRNVLIFSTMIYTLLNVGKFANKIDKHLLKRKQVL